MVTLMTMTDFIVDRIEKKRKDKKEKEKSFLGQLVSSILTRQPPMLCFVCAFAIVLLNCYPCKINKEPTQRKISSCIYSQ